jgi:hypothetical protein
MPTTTTNLNLTKPGLGEYTDTWHTPLNDNFTKIDEWAGKTELEITNARFTKSTLKAFLEVAHSTDGTLLPTQETIDTRNSYLYGFEYTPYTVAAQTRLRDKEMWAARAGQASLKAATAYKQSLLTPSMILSGLSDPDGYPIYASLLGSKVVIDGTTTPLQLMIDGNLCRTRTQKEVLISGGTATYYVYAEYQADGVANVTGSSGSAGTDGTNLCIHQDITKNYPTLDVQAGDVLRYTTPGALQGDYLVQEVSPGGSGNESKIKTHHLFPQAGGSLAYEVRDPLAVTYGFSATETAVAGRLYIAEADYNGTNVTAVRPRHFKDTFVGAWHAVDVSSTPSFEEIWNHNLGSAALEVTVQASLVNTDLGDVEELDICRLGNTLSVTAGIGTLAAGAGTLAATTIGTTLTTATNATPPDAHTHGFTVTPTATTIAGSPTLSGSPTASLTGAVTPYSSVVVKYTKNQIWVKNAVPSAFFRDYGGSNRQTGYLRVIITKKG